MEKKNNPALPETMEHIIHQHSLEELAGQLFCPAAFIHDDEEGMARIAYLIREHKIGGLTFFHSRASAATNYEKREVVSYSDSLEKLQRQIAYYQSISEIPLLISIDAEWGLAMRVEDTPQYPYAITLGALAESDDELIYEVALQIGKDLKSAGVDYNLAPVADINSNPDNPVIGYRSFGASREAVFRKSLQYCKGLSDAGVLNCLKHFPGHGDTAVDSHLGLPVIKKTRAQLEALELYPFKKLIARGVDSVMVGHLAVPALSGDPALPATLSAGIIKKVLREEYGFTGAVISDALNMRSVCDLYPEKGLLELKAFEAGNDILCFSEHIKEGKEKILDAIPGSDILKSVRRIFALKEKAGLFGKDNRPDRQNYEVARALNLKIAERSIIATRNTHPVADTIIVIGDHKRENAFTADLKTFGNYSVIKVDNAVRSLNMSSQKGVIIALFPPHIKPVDNFGITAENLHLIGQLLKEHKTSLFLFGNPYCIERIDNREQAENIVLCGQDLREFQEVAAAFVQGKTKVSGTMPFSL